MSLIMVYIMYVYVIWLLRMFYSCWLCIDKLFLYLYMGEVGRNDWLLEGKRQSVAEPSKFRISVLNLFSSQICFHNSKILHRSIQLWFLWLFIAGFPLFVAVIFRLFVFLFVMLRCFFSLCSF